MDMILRKDFAAENVDSLIEFAKANGGIEYAEARMKEYHDKAVDVLLRLPESGARTSLIQLADYDSLQIEIPLSISCREMALVSKKVSMLQ